jgi:MoaA/NifB/PqqE/SkfB family radical SAM enzyme
MRQKMSQVNDLQKFIENKTGSSTFCILPWIHAATETNGAMRLCCASNTKGISNEGNNGAGVNLKDTTISKEYNNNYYQQVRQKMLKGKEPADCRKCFSQESMGIISKRLWETREWHNQGIDITQIKSTKSNYPVYLDLRLGNTCNLKCTMCSPHDSSQWVKDYSKLNDDTQKLIDWNKENNNQFWFRNHDFKQDLYGIIPYLQQLQFAGGEPLMIPEHKELLDKIVNQGYSQNITLKYNTNAMLVDSEVINIWKKFKKVKVSVSLDGIGKRGEYIRYPMQWEILEKNLDLLDNTPSNIDVTIAVTVQLMNIKHLPDFARWKIKKNFRKINLDFIEDVQLGAGIFNMHLLYIPTFLSIQALPLEDKKEVEELFLNLKKEITIPKFCSNPLGWPKWQSLIDFMYKEQTDNLLIDFRTYINNLDTVRNTNFKSVFPELAHLI